NEFDPEFIDNFELSLRSEWLDRALVLNANAYYGIWEDQQLAVPIENNPSITFTENAGESTIWGFEVEADYAATDRTQLFAGVGYAQTEFEEFCSINSTAQGLPDCTLNGVSGKDLSGNDFAVSPAWTASAGGQHFLTDRWYGQANVTYQSGSFSDVENVRRLKTDGFALANASLGYEGEGFDVRLYVRNVFDTSYQLRLTDFQNGVGVLTGSPREYGVIVSAEF
ncbi:MAG: TonB-dependent receptor, partial [Pseudomonadota bacterium]